MSASGKTLVLGGTGILGTRVVEMLLARRRAVRVLTRHPARHARLGRLGVEVVAGDLREPGSLRSACEGTSAIVAAAHSALGRGRYSSEAIDGAAHERLIDIAAGAAVERFVYISVQGASARHPVPFWRIKARTEDYLRRSRVPHLILRPTAFMDFHGDVLIGQRVREGRTVMLIGTGTNPRNFVAADDVARMVMVGLERDTPSETVDVGGPENPSNNDVIASYARATGRMAKVQRLPLGIAGLIQRVARVVHPGVGQVLLSAIVAETTDQTWHGAAGLDHYGVKPVRLEDWLSARARVSVATRASGAA
jgi:NADH dehydrogenase